MPCPGPFHLSYSVDYIYDFCPLPDPDIGISIFVCDVEHTFSILVCAAEILFHQGSLYHYHQLLQVPSFIPIVPIPYCNNGRGTLWPRLTGVYSRRRGF